MNSFEFFDLVAEDYDNKFKSSPLTREEILEIFKISSSKIDIFSGEMFMFNDEEFTAKASKILSESDSQLEICVACGNRIIGIKKDGKAVNPFLEMINRYDNRVLYFNNFSLVEQIANGYIHAIIVDGGKRIYIEEPHNYSRYKNYDASNDSTKSFLLENEYDLALEIMDRYKSYMNFDDVAQNEDAYKIINDSTFSEHEFFNSPKDGDFYDRNDYEKLWQKKLSEGTENLKDIIDIEAALEKALKA